MFCCVTSDDTLFDDSTIDHNYYEDNGVIAIYLSLLSELDKIDVTSETIERYHSYLSEGVPNFYNNLLNGTLTDFKVNTTDSIFATLVIGTYYGLDSEPYNVLKQDLLANTIHDLGILEIPISCLKYRTKKIHVPERDIFGSFLSEAEDPNCYRIPNTGRIALFSDWATGSPSALNVAREIAKMNPDIVIHLGDVYYSGRLSEHKRNFVTPIRDIILSKCPQTRVFMIPGNHDWYSGSKGIKYSLKAFGQHSTYFHLYNDRLDIHGFDTGLHDADCFKQYSSKDHNTFIDDEEVKWHKYRIENSNRKLMLLSHHPLVTPWYHPTLGKDASPLNPNLFEQLRDIIPKTEIWFSGHCHVFDVIEPYTYKDVTASRLRLIGNGSAQSRKFELPKVSDTEDKKHDPEIYAVSRRIYPKTFDGLLNCSFVIIDMMKDKLLVKYYEVPQISLGKFGPAKVLYQETIPL
jgi:predicted phosphohydrolase